jgi:hypothetical protein
MIKAIEVLQTAQRAMAGRFKVGRRMEHLSDEQEDRGGGD